MLGVRGGTSPPVRRVSVGYLGVLGLQSLDLEAEAGGSGAAVRLMIFHLLPQTRNLLLQVAADVRVRRLDLRLQEIHVQLMFLLQLREKDTEKLLGVDIAAPYGKAVFCFLNNHTLILHIVHRLCCEKVFALHSQSHAKISSVLAYLITLTIRILRDILMSN